MKNDALYLKHIRSAITTIEQYSKGIDERAFFKNKLLQDGIVRELEIIGKASKQLSVSLKRASFYIPWDDVAGMRDKLIHEYFGVDLEVVWKTVKEDLKILKDFCNEILQKR